MSELISVIVPVYNTGPYLRRCIESIVAQDYPNLEIIIVDDGSSDIDTIRLCDILSDSYNNVCTYHKPNGGQSSARNYGITLAKGEYIGFIDSDDVIEPTMYSTLYKCLLDNNVKVAIGGVAIEENHKRIDRLNSLPSGCLDSHQLLHYFFLGHFHSSCTNLYKRCLFDNIRFPENEINEDYMLNYYIFKQLDAVYIDETIYYHYIRREGSTTASPVSLKFLSWIKHTTIILNDYKDSELKEEAYHQYLFSNVILGNKCLLSLARNENSDADKLYKLVTSNLNSLWKQAFLNKYLSFRNKLCSTMLAFMPSIYRFLVISALRIKNR